MVPGLSFSLHLLWAPVGTNHVYSTTLWLQVSPNGLLGFLLSLFSTSAEHSHIQRNTVQNYVKKTCLLLTAIKSCPRDATRSRDASRRMYKVGSTVQSDRNEFCKDRSSRRQLWAYLRNLLENGISIWGQPPADREELRQYIQWHLRWQQNVKYANEILQCLGPIFFPAMSTFI